MAKCEDEDDDKEERKGEMMRKVMEKWMGEREEGEREVEWKAVNCRNQVG